MQKIDKRKKVQRINGFYIEYIEKDLWLVSVQGGSFWEKMSTHNANSFINNKKIDSFKNIIN